MALTAEEIEAQMAVIKSQLQQLQLAAKYLKDRPLERQLNAAWRELEAPRGAFT